MVAVTPNIAVPNDGIVIPRGTHYRYYPMINDSEIRNLVGNVGIQQIQVIEPSMHHLLYEANLKMTCEERKKDRRTIEKYYFLETVSSKMENVLIFEHCDPPQNVLLD